MDIRTAIENLKHIASEIRFDTSVREIKQIKRDKIKSIGMAIMALEKQIPKKPVKDKYHRYCCPACEHIIFIHNPSLLDEFSPYCENCGQAIDWSEDEAKQ